MPPLIAHPFADAPNPEPRSSHPNALHCLIPAPAFWFLARTGPTLGSREPGILQTPPPSKKRGITRAVLNATLTGAAYAIFRHSTSHTTALGATCLLVLASATQTLALHLWWRAAAALETTSAPSPSPSTRAQAIWEQEKLRILTPLLILLATGGFLLGAHRFQDPDLLEVASSGCILNILMLGCPFSPMRIQMRHIPLVAIATATLLEFSQPGFLLVHTWTCSLILLIPTSLSILQRLLKNTPDPRTGRRRCLIALGAYLYLCIGTLTGVVLGSITLPLQISRNSSTHPSTHPSTLPPRLCHTWPLASGNPR